MTVFSPEYPRPIWRLSLDGRDLADVINPRFMSLSLTETRDDQADQLTLNLTDHDGLLEIPNRGAVIRVAIGWSTTGLVDKGSFTVDETGHRGTPDTVSIRARSADMTGPLRTRTERSFHGKTIKQIVEEIALANGLTAIVGEGFRDKVVKHIDQSNESDAAFLNRIGKRYDAVATVKDDRLLFMPVRGAKTASGQDMPVHEVYRRDGDQHDFLITGRDAYTGVKAFWMDPRKTTRRSVMVGVIGNAKHLRDTFANETDALAAAQSEWQRIRRGLATMRFSMAYGRPELSAQHKVLFPDMKKPINEIDWLVRELTHDLNESGLTTGLDLEMFDKEDAGTEDDSVLFE
ncbi:contractile injection system protein, VgrG/Pvc8 family [Pusillimonas sp. NJUB218]|uniref:contractile injection system protein, VgrG/Pvc8 family n=1 Tax=Pusillimonas sp. NJUB218 TaxID=2023230 RepID=UPI000F4B9DEA|nr:contractile injection system protein, VgrG/Pvc8 family [Pusillimonas sp. NJUB218]ROT46090.1 hypothetical protein CHR62_03690 [Pusillimonas sp. NJUB218]